MMKATSLKHRIKAYFDLIRPFTLLAPLIVSSCIMIASFFYNGKTDDLFSIYWKIIFPASFSFAILNGASNALNQVTDLRADKISKPYRPIPQGLISTNAALSISLIMFILAFTISLFINIVFSFFLILITIFSVTYSLPPRIKDYLFLNQIWVGVPRGLLAVLASWSVFGSVLQPLPLTIGIISMFFLIGGSVTKDITDGKADKKTGTNTLINTYGIKNAAFMILPFMFFPFAFVPILIDVGILEPYLFLLTFLMVPSYLIFHFMIRDKTKSRHLENTSSWTLMYVTYFIFALGFSILTIQGSIVL